MIVVEDVEQTNPKAIDLIRFIHSDLEDRISYISDKIRD